MDKNYYLTENGLNNIVTSRMTKANALKEYQKRALASPENIYDVVRLEVVYNKTMADLDSSTNRMKLMLTSKLKPLLRAHALDSKIPGLLKLVANLVNNCDSKKNNVALAHVGRAIDSFKKGSVVKAVKNKAFVAIQVNNCLRMFADEVLGDDDDIDMICLYLSDIADHLIIAQLIAKDEKSKVSDRIRRLDTSSREMLPDSVYSRFN